MDRERYPAYKVTITERPTGHGCALHQESYYLVIHEEALRLQHLVSGDIVLELPYTHIRKYMITPNTFSIEAGRMCILGEGVFRMDTFEGKSIMDKVNKRKEITMERLARIQNRQRSEDDFYSEPYSLDTCNKGLKAIEVASPSENEGIPVHIDKSRSSPRDYMESDGVTVVRLTEASRQNVDTRDTEQYLTPMSNNLSGEYRQINSGKRTYVTQTEQYVNLTPNLDSGMYLSPIHSNHDETGKEEMRTEPVQRKDHQTRRPVPQMVRDSAVPYQPNPRLHMMREESQTRSHLVPATSPRQRVDKRYPIANVQCLTPTRSDNIKHDTNRRPIKVSFQTQDREDNVPLYLNTTLRNRHGQKTQRLPLCTSPIQPSDGHVFSSPTSVQEDCEILSESKCRDMIPLLGRTTKQPSGMGKPLRLWPTKMPQSYFRKPERNDSGTETYVNVNVHPK